MGPVERISSWVSRLLVEQLVEQHLIANTLEDLRRKGQLFAPKIVDPNGVVALLRTMSRVESTPNQVQGRRASCGDRSVRRFRRRKW